MLLSRSVRRALLKDAATCKNLKPEDLTPSTLNYIVLFCSGNRKEAFKHVIKTKGVPVIKDIVYQPEELCLEAVREDGLALKHIRDQTDCICMEAVVNNALALKFARCQTPDMCRIATEKDKHAFIYIKNPFYRIYFMPFDVKVEYLVVVACSIVVACVLAIAVASVLV